MRLAGAGVAVVVGVARSGGCGSGRYGGGGCGSGSGRVFGGHDSGGSGIGEQDAVEQPQCGSSAVWPQRQWWQRHSRLYEGRVATTTSRADRKCRIS